MERNHRCACGGQPGDLVREGDGPEQGGRGVAEDLREETREYLAGVMEEMSPAEVEAFTKSVEKFVASGRSRRAKDLAADGGTPS